MATTIKNKSQDNSQPAVRYADEDLTPRDSAADDVAIDAYIKRNKSALDASIAKAKSEFEHGDYFGFDEVGSEIAEQKRSRQTGNR